MGRRSEPHHDADGRAADYWAMLMDLIMEGYHDFEFGHDSDTDESYLISAGREHRGTTLMPGELVEMMHKSEIIPRSPSHTNQGKDGEG